MQTTKKTGLAMGLRSMALLALLSPATQAGSQTGSEATRTTSKAQVSGEVVDLWCFTDHHGRGADHRACAVACVEAGNPIGIVDDKGKAYIAMGAKKHQPGRALLIEHMAEHVMVTGRIAKLGSTDVIYVDSVVELQGYCPVAYKMAGKAIRGQVDYSAIHDGKLYYFVKPEARQAFLKNPASFVPVSAGECIVCEVNMHEKVAGDPRIFSVYKGKTYLFKGADQKKAFDAAPERFLKASKG